MRTHISLIAGILLLAACQSTAPPTEASVGAVEGAPPYTNITPGELATMLAAKDFLFVNTHIPYEGEIADTDAFIPFDELDAYASQLPADKDAKIVLYCRSGRMSAIAAEELAAKGYTHLYNLDGGMVAWDQEGYPLEFR